MGHVSRPARSTYRGLKVTITQLPDKDVGLVSLSAKSTNGHWDDWSLLYPALRVRLREINGHQDVLRVIVDAVEELIRLDKENA